MRGAALGGHLGALRWAREHGCPWDATTCSNAARGGHLELLMWAREQEHGCPWDEETCSFAALGGHLELLRWARAHHCPWEANMCASMADVNRHAAVGLWVRAQSTRALTGNAPTYQIKRGKHRR